MSRRRRPRRHHAGHHRRAESGPIERAARALADTLPRPSAKRSTLIAIAAFADGGETSLTVGQIADRAERRREGVAAAIEFLARAGLLEVDVDPARPHRSVYRVLVDAPEST